MDEQLMNNLLMKEQPHSTFNQTHLMTFSCVSNYFIRQTPAWMHDPLDMMSSHDIDRISKWEEAIGYSTEGAQVLKILNKINNWALNYSMT